MPNTKTVVPYSGTPEQEAQLKAVIAEYKDVPGGIRRDGIRSPYVSARRAMSRVLRLSWIRSLPGWDVLWAPFPRMASIL